MSAELGRSPTPAELAARTETSIEQVMDALAARSAQRADSLDRPLTEDGGTAMDLARRATSTRATRTPRTRRSSTRCWPTLPDREREVLRLRFEQDLTQAEIGERLGLSQMHISRLIRRSITRLQSAAQA